MTSTSEASISPRSLVATFCAAVVFCAGLVGCSAFRSDDDLLEGGYRDGVFRPEGVSADKNRKSNFLESVGLAQPKRKDFELATQQFKEADTMFQNAGQMQGEERTNAFRAASNMYKKSADNWQNSDLAQDALLGCAEALFFAEDYYQADQYYSKLVKEYPKTRYLDHVERRIWDIGDYWLSVGKQNNSPFYVVNFTDPKKPWNDTEGHGERIYETMRMNNPTGKLADDATMRLAMQRYENKDFEAAAATFAELRTIYPDSEHQLDAQRYELQSLLASYQGPNYSSVPLSDAKKRVDQIPRLFPVKSREHAEELAKARSTIDYLEAERIWGNATYRMARDENASAKFHLSRILNEYPNTPFAEKAAQAAERIKDARPEPAQHFKWIADAFGENKEDRPWLRNRQ
ncbi:MAG: tetratricopeptide repeat protein [Aureliella sp.]